MRPAQIRVWSTTNIDYADQEQQDGRSSNDNLSDEESKGEQTPERSKISYYKTIEKESNTVFILKHESDEALDMRVELYQDAETVEFDGLPMEL